jgi:hypothetical protein
VVRSATDQHEAAITIAAFDEARLVDLQPHARVAERGPRRDVAGAVAHHAGSGDAEDLGGLVAAHVARNSKRPGAAQSLQAKCVAVIGSGTTAAGIAVAASKAETAAATASAVRERRNRKASEAIIMPHRVGPEV